MPDEVKKFIEETMENWRLELPKEGKRFGVLWFWLWFLRELYQLLSFNFDNVLSGLFSFIFILLYLLITDFVCKIIFESVISFGSFRY